MKLPAVLIASAFSSAIALLPCAFWPSVYSAGAAGSDDSAAAFTRDKPRVIRDQDGLPLTRIDYLISKRKGSEARRLIDAVKPTAANQNLIHIWRGLSYRADREPELAVAEFDKCSSLVEGKDWYGLIAGSYGQTEHYAKAIQILTAAIAANPHVASFYADRADFNCALGKFGEAIPDYKRAAAQNSDRKRLFLSVAAELLRRQGKLKEAMEVLDSGLNVPERLSDGKYWLCRAQIETQQKHWAEGEKNCTIGLKVSRKACAKNQSTEEIAVAHLLLERAKCYQHLGKQSLADADLKEHLKFSAATEDEILGKMK